MRKREAEVVEASSDDFVLVDNRRNSIVRLQNGDPKAEKYFDLIPGPNRVPAPVWLQALGNDIVKILLEEEELIDLGVNELSQLSLPTAISLVSRPMSVPLAQQWLETEGRKRIQDKLKSAIEAA